MDPPSCFIDRKSGAVLFDIDMKNTDGPIFDLHGYTAGHERSKG